MKNFIIAFLAVLIFAPVAMAGPFLVSDPTTEPVETYEVYRDGELVEAGVAAQPDGSLKYDLEGLAPGVYTFTATACAAPWGCSELSDPFESPQPASKPAGLRLEP